MTDSNFSVINFGCRLNAYESEIIRENLAVAARIGITATDAATPVAPVIVINSCAVTAEAERQVQQAIRRAKRLQPEARIIVTGCAAQINPEKFAAMSEVTRVIGNIEKLDPLSYLFNGNEPAVQVADIMAVTDSSPHLIAGFGGRSRAFIEVQQGCDHRCTFCIIPFGRGNSRSVAVGAIVTQIQQLVATGCNEVVLTGVDLASWGGDLPAQPKLGQLVQRILRLVPELPRLRLSSLDPAAIDDELWQAWESQPRLMPHLHLSIQHGSDLILKRMKRRHLREQVLSVVAKARRLRPELAIGADFIAGFPTESDGDFQESMALASECKLAFLHVFPYSIRPDTPAAKMPQVAKPVITQRARQLRLLGKQLAANYYQERLGKSESVLLEQEKQGVWHGHTAAFAPISVPTIAAQSSSTESNGFKLQSGTILPGTILPVTVSDFHAEGLVGQWQ